MCDIYGREYLTIIFHRIRAFGGRCDIDQSLLHSILDETLRSSIYIYMYRYLSILQIIRESSLVFGMCELSLEYFFSLLKKRRMSKDTLILHVRSMYDIP